MARFSSRILSVLTGRISAIVVVVAAVAVAGVIVAGAGSTTISNDPTASLPSSAQSTEVARLQRRLPSGQTNPALAVYSRPGQRLTEADVRAIRGQFPELRRLALGGHLSPLIVAPDRTAALLSVPLAANVDSSETSASVKEIRRVARSGLPTGLRAQVTGGAGFTADIANAFNGANITLLIATVAIVALLLLITYRSPILWLVPLIAVGLADVTTSGLIAWVSRHSSVPISQATTGIVEVLVFGAGTDYALLLIARYREELTRQPDRREAMRHALRTAGPTILASGATVALALLTLLLADLGDDKAIGVAGAIGVATAVLFGLLVLPAALVSLPRAIFWPRIPRYQEGDHSSAESGRVWRRVGEATARRPWPIATASVVLLLVMSAGLFGAKLGLSQTETFRTKSEAVDGLNTLARAFPAGAADPVAVITTPAQAATVTGTLRRLPGVARVTSGERAGEISQLDVELTAAPDTPASYTTIRAMRHATAGIQGGRVLVGGTVATNLDARTAALRDLWLIAPLILAVVAIILTVLLRSLVAPIVLMATVVLSYLAALGASTWLFTHLLGYHALDNQVPLLSFLFLIALGIDYNIFLTTRAREEAVLHGTRQGIINALAATGGVITSAGILLAAVFTVLGVLPVIVLTELGIIVGLGVLLDTLLVRTILVPALIHILGDTFWKPGAVSSKRTRQPSPHAAALQALTADDGPN